MSNAKQLIIIVLSTVLFTAFFYKESLALNLCLFECFTFAALLLSKRLQIKSLTSAIVFVGTIVTSLIVVYHNSAISIVINVLSFIVFVGLLLYPATKSLPTALQLSLSNLLKSHTLFFDVLWGAMSKRNKIKVLLRYIRIIIIPLIIIYLFILIYRLANPIFAEYIDRFNSFIVNVLHDVFIDIEVLAVFVFILGWLISNFIFLGKPNSMIIRFEENKSDNLERKRHRKFINFKMNSLLNEYRAALFLLGALNALLLIVNVIDINWVWLNFSWNGTYLKQFVHNGTYLLIISILISIAITLYYFRGNLNFYKNNIWLKRLAALWMCQNAILTISVGIRNLHYINYFALAYLRIGVIFFLLLTIFGIVTVILKIYNKKSAFYLFRINSLGLYVILVIMTVFNWDIIIAKYNFSHYQKSFVHYKFLLRLSPKALPYADKTPEELALIDSAKVKNFSFVTDDISSQIYYDEIQLKKTRFLKQWEKHTWLSWNYADAQAYTMLNKVKSD